MSTETTNQSKLLSAEIAGMLASPAPDRTAILEKLLALGYTRPSDTRAFIPGDDFEFEGNVGIYCPVGKNGQTYYERDPRCKERWSYFADVQVIPARSQKKRVVLLGESVARGFLLDPDFTPAIMLQSLLRVNTAVEDYEVIDLAETNLGMAGLQRRFEQSLVLEPDVIVFLAGNNWRTDLQVLIDTDSKSSQRLHDVIQQNGSLENIKPIVEEIFSGMVSEFLRTIGLKAAELRIPLLFAIPEFNLADCHSTPGERFVSFLPGRKMQHWIESRNQASVALQTGDFKALEELGRKMIATDSTHPLGYEYLAQSQLSQGKSEEARRSLELARDTALFCRTNSKPRVFEIIKTVMRNEFPNYGIHSIDLGEVFKEYLKGEVPGKRLFLDYCHFSVEGIQVAMSAVAAQVLAIVSGPGTSSTMNSKSVVPDKDTFAYCHLFAAIHNAHWGQPYDILEYHASKALSYSRDIARIMIYYCEMMSRAASNNLCKSFELLIKDNRIDKYVHTMIHPRSKKTMEISLVDAMVNAMKKAGIQMESVVRDLRIKEHGVQGQQLDLLNPSYHSTSYDEYQGTKTAHYQSRDNVSRFFLVAAANTNVTLHLTLRIPNVAHDDTNVVLTLCDDFNIELEASSQWKDFIVDIPGTVIKGGVNYIDIQWPWHFEIMNKQNESMTTRFGDSSESVLDASFFVFGEIMKFTAASPAPETDETESTTYAEIEKSLA